MTDIPSPMPYGGNEGTQLGQAALRTDTAWADVQVNRRDENLPMEIEAEYYEILGDRLRWLITSAQESGVDLSVAPSDIEYARVMYHLAAGDIAHFAREFKSYFDSNGEKTPEEENLLEAFGEWVNVKSNAKAWKNS